MTAIKTAAKQRLTQIYFGAASNISSTTYTCPACSACTTFSVRNFDQSLFNKASCLSPEIIGEFAACRPLITTQWEDFLDFYCDDCGLAVRVIYTSSEFRMACHQYQLKDVLEQ